MDDKQLNQLLKRVTNNNCKRSFETIFDYYYPKLVDFADLYLESRQSAEEVASDALLKLFVKRHYMMSIEKPQSYLYTTVKNLSLSHLRKAKKELHFFKQPETLELQKFGGASPDEKLLEEEFAAVIIQIVDAMPPRRKMIFKLVKQEEKSYKEVSALLNISIKTVEVHMGLAISQIRLSLENYEKRNNFNYLQIVKSLLILFAI